MIRSILNIAIRQFTRHLTFSSISIGGLVVAITAGILTFLWVNYELTYDHYHPDNNKAFWILSNEKYEGEISTYERTPIKLAEFLSKEVPEIEDFTRMDRSRAQITYKDKIINEFGYYAEPGFFNVFNAHVIAGNEKSLLPDNNSIVISSSLARSIFGNIDVLGKVLLLDTYQEYVVKGVYEDFPINSSLGSDASYILPFFSKKRDFEGDWKSTIVKLRSPELRKTVENKIDKKFKELFENEKASPYLFCLTDWRLRWNFENGQQSGGRIVYVIIFGLSALFVIIMACINYMNLSTARAAKRAREIGVRKMSGATRSVLIKQFLIESMSISILSVCISLMLSYLLLPIFSNLVRTQLILDLTDSSLIVGLVSITLFTGLLAGSYPALLLSSFKPITVLKGNLNSTLMGEGLRKILVVFQFSLSIIMIFSAVVLWQQVDFLLQKDLGFDKNNVVYVDIQTENNISIEGFKDELKNSSSILSASAGAASPMETNGSAEVRRRDQSADYTMIFSGASIDYDYLPTLGFEFVKGRNFSRDIASDSSNYIITQKAADLLGFDDPIDQVITYNMFGLREGNIIGVIKDFHNEDIHAPIDPVIFFLGNGENYGSEARIFVKYKADQLDYALAHIKTAYNKIQTGFPVQYGFLDQDFEYQFYMEKLMKKLSVSFTIIAMIIACLGLFGLTLFSTQKRIKEIGVRKVLGASVSQIVILLWRDFSKPVLISCFIAFPIGYYIMNKFLEGYIFRIEINFLSFLIVISSMTILVLMSVTFQSVKAALTNPSDSLKNE